jgi:hypothetical protein
MSKTSLETQILRHFHLALFFCFTVQSRWRIPEAVIYICSTQHLEPMYVIYYICNNVCITVLLLQDLYSLKKCCSKSIWSSVFSRKRNVNLFVKLTL